MLIGKRTWITALALVPLAACGSHDEKSTGSATDPSTADKNAASGIPCEVAKVLSDHCTTCHGSTPMFGAPFSLTSVANFQAPAASDKSKKVFELVPSRINATDPTKRMPPASSKALDDAESKTLNDWLAQGAPAAASSCPVTDAVIPGVSGSGATDVSGQSGGASIDPITYDDPELECYNLVAFDPSDRTKPYSVPTTPDLYTEFNFKPPWTGTKYMRSVELIIDNKAVIHHWLLFKSTGAITSDSVTPNALGAHPDGILLHGWAPGASPMYLAPDVGQKMEGDLGYQLETHYNNTTGAPAPDASGARVCVTPKVPTHEAAMSWLGTDAIFGTTASGTCKPSSSETIHIIAAQPHMHLKGRHMKVVVNRADGSADTIHDDDFDFEYQRYYPLNVTINPGDTITTTCTYSDVAMFGKGTNQEMCYFFSLHWPALALTSAGLGTIIHGANTCM